MPTEELKELIDLEEITDALGEDFLGPSGYPNSRDNDSVVQTINESAMSAEFIIVTRGQATNRNNTMVHITPQGDFGGMLTENYINNPVVLWNHGYDFSLPIGISESPNGKSTVKKFKKRMEATVHFSQVLPEAEMIFALVAEGILRTASIGFLPLIAKQIKLEAAGRKLTESEETWSGTRGYDFLESELFEWSVVDVPADPGALRKRLELGQCNGVKLRGPVGRRLKAVAEPKPVIGIGLGLESPSKVQPFAEVESCAKNIANALRLDQTIREGFKI